MLKVPLVFKVQQVLQVLKVLREQVLVEVNTITLLLLVRQRSVQPMLMVQILMFITMVSV